MASIILNAEPLRAVWYQKWYNDVPIMAYIWHYSGGISQYTKLRKTHTLTFPCLKRE